MIAPNSIKLLAFLSKILTRFEYYNNKRIYCYTIYKYRKCNTLIQSRSLFLVLCWQKVHSTEQATHCQVDRVLSQDLSLRLVGYKPPAATTRPQLLSSCGLFTRPLRIIYATDILFMRL